MNAKLFQTLTSNEMSKLVGGEEPSCKTSGGGTIPSEIPELQVHYSADTTGEGGSPVYHTGEDSTYTKLPDCPKAEPGKTK